MVSAHLRYARYVAIHKLYVFAAGIAIGGWSPRWLWRLLIHDSSKLRPSEWTPYVAMFYGPPTEDAEVKKQRQARFNYAWLLHQHRNPHHWQHWMLKEDSGKMIVLTPPAHIVDEMVADWIGAGTKILRWPSFAEAVASTIAWYAQNRERIILREHARARVEETLHALAMTYGLVAMAQEVEAAKAARASIVIPGR